MSVRWIYAIFATVLLVLAVPGRCSAQNTVTCASNDGGRQYCAADTRAGVRLLRQNSQSPCVQNQTWGFDGRNVWVDRGCRAVFQLGYAAVPGGPGSPALAPGTYVVTCESNKNHRRYCEINDPRSQVNLLQQLGSNPCTHGATWGNDGLGIWVDRGCRATFTVTIYNGTPAWWWNSGGHHRPTDEPRIGACFFREAHYNGDYFCQEKGTSLNVPQGFNDQISSIRTYGHVTVTFYNDANFGGANASTRDSVADLRSWSLGPYTNKNWNNRISSIRIY
ncbi:MAG: DUF3011 domain-containing protein [Candidatus Acidiferrales bacterium]